MFSDVTISEVDALLYVVLSEAETHLLHGALVATTACMTLYLGCRTNRGHYSL